MKKTVVKQRLSVRIMKITLIQLAISYVISTAAFAHEASGQEMLEKRVTIELNNIDLDKGLSKIEEVAKVKFSYNSRMKQLNNKVTIIANDESLLDIFNRILKPLKIIFSEVNHQIILQNEIAQPITLNFESPTLSNKNTTNEGPITGIVTDKQGAPLAGVTIIEEGTRNNTTTDYNGKYILKNVSPSSKLIFSYMGLATQEVLVGDQKVISIILLDLPENLKSVVVVAYGSQKKNVVTGAVSTVNAKDIAALPILNSELALQGRAAGVNVYNSGSPGSAPVVLIRGLGTIGNANPLYVVDGVIVGNLTGLSPNDIESMSTLKDASTTALYGSQGANGVILVTTKKGKKGVGKLDFSTYVGFQEITKRYPVLNTSQYLQYQKELGNPPINRPAEIFQNNVNYQDEIFTTGLMQNYNLSFSSGTDVSTSRYSSEFVRQEGAIIGTAFERYSFRANNTHTFGRLTLGSNMAISFSKRNPERGAGFSNIENAIKAAPYLPVYNLNNLGGFQGPTSSIDYQDAFNPVFQATFGEVIDRTTNIIGNIYAELELMKGLKFRTQVALDYFSTNNRIFTPAYLNDNILGFQTHSQPDALTDRTLGNGQTLIINNGLTFKKTFQEKHNLEVLALVEKNMGKGETVTAASRYAISNDIDQFNFASATKLASNSYEDFKIGYVGRLNYDFDEKYIAAFSVRRDASSRFGANFRWANFYSVAAGWNIAKENFMKKSLFNTLKIRGSYGTTGNDKIRNYQYSATLQGNYIYPIANAAALGTSLGNLPNPNLKWEQKTMQNYGLDFSILKNSLTGSIEYFKNKSDDLLSNVPVTPSLGTVSGLQARNVAAVETKGFEFTLGYNDIKGAFTWSTNINFGTSRNEVLSLGGVTEQIGTIPFKAGGGMITRATVGESLYYFYGYLADGIYKNKAEVDAVFTKNPTQTVVQPGDVRYKDINGDGEINSNDRVKIGNPYPKFTYGANFNAAYKNFDFNFFVTGVQGNSIFNTNLFDLQGNLKFNAGVQVLDRARVINDVVVNPETNIPRALGATQNTAVSSRFVEDGSYARLKNITIGYTFKNEVFSKYFSKLRIYASGQNLITVTKYSGLDPEIAAGGSFETGIDRGNYPQPKSVVFGLDLSF